MELLIPGLLLVALMVWASTRIKRNAASAFDAETIETDEFAVNKPEGFLHVLNDDSGLAFRAYSKEYGTAAAGKDLRQAYIEIEKHAGSSIDEVRREIVDTAEQIDGERSFLEAGEKAAFVESKSVRDGAEYDVLHKLVTRGDAVYEARVSVLSEHREEYSRKLEEIFVGLTIK